MDSTRLQLQRTMSLRDISTSSAIRDAIERDLTVPADRSKHRFFLQLPRHDFILPSLTRFDQDFRKFLLSALVDFSLKQELEDRKCLNWCSILPKFLPLQTLGDGNCLMHAVSLCMWAVQDRRLTLRKSVYQVLVEDQTDMFRKRWQLEQEKRLEEQHGSSVDCSNEQWNEDWKKTVDLASTTKSSETHSLNALEEIHVFTLANILRRPIFVLCDDIHRGNYDESLADVNLGGIYLPLLCDSVDCVKSPLVIGYHQGHFTALVTTEDGWMTGEDMLGQRKNKIAIPLMKYDDSALKLHFLLPEEQQSSERLLREYLNCSKIAYTNNEATRTILVATIESQEPEAHLHQMFKTYFEALQEVYLEKLTERQLSMYGERLHPSVMQSGNQHYGMKYHAPETAISPAVKTSSRCCSAHRKCKNAVCENYTTQDYCHQCRKSKPQLCTSPGCSYTANPNSEGLCSACFARFRAILEQGPPHMMAPSAPPSNMCSTLDCQKQACPQFHGKCHDCFLKYIHDPNFGNNTFASSEPIDEPSTSREKHEPHSALSRQNSRLFCFSERCKNLLQNSEQIYCEHCLACLPPESKTHLQTLISRNIEICCVFGCNLPAITYHGQLCYQHYKESQGRHQNDDHVPTPKMARLQEATKCISIGCNFFGVPDHNYLCSKCHAKALQEQYDVEKIKAEQERAQAEWIAKLARRRAEQCQFDFYGCNASPKPFYHEVISTPTTSSSAPPSPNQRKTASDTVPCATKGCPHLGFKHTEGLCEVCYKKEEMLLYQGMSRQDRFSSLP